MMKKLLTFLLIAILTITPMQISFASGSDEAYISVSFSPESGIISVVGADYVEQGSPAVMYLIPYDEEVTELTPPILAEMFFVKKDGAFSISAKVPEGTPNGKYIVRVGTQSREVALEKNILLYFNDSQDTRDALSLLNGSANYELFASYIAQYGEDVGIEAETIGDMTVFSKALWGIKENEGSFTLTTFANASAFAKGAVILADSQDVDDVMKNYANAFDYSYDEYTSLSTSVKDKANELLKSLPTNAGYISYRELVLVAKAATISSYGKLKELISQNSASFGIDLGGKYKSLSNNEKSNVFKIIFNKRDNFASLEDIANAFSAAVSSVSGSTESGGSGGGGGGGGTVSDSSDSRGHIGNTTNITGIGETFGTESMTFSFNDIESSFAKENIENLVSFSVINGYEDGSFRPQNNVTRAEFCKIVCLAFGFEPKTDLAFDDVKASDWFAPYVGALHSLGIVSGDGTGFKPSANLTRQDGAVILSNVMRALGKNVEGSFEFLDSESISDYAKESVSALAFMGFLKGDGINFHPTASITRAETAAMVDRIYSSMK